MFWVLVRVSQVHSTNPQIIWDRLDFQPIIWKLWKNMGSPQWNHMESSWLLYGSVLKSLVSTGVWPDLVNRGARGAWGRVKDAWRFNSSTQNPGEECLVCCLGVLYLGRGHLDFVGTCRTWLSAQVWPDSGEDHLVKPASFRSVFGRFNQLCSLCWGMINPLIRDKQKHGWCFKA